MSVTYASERNSVSKQNPQSLRVANTTGWTRPGDWLTLPTVTTSDQTLVGLYAVYDTPSNYVALTATTDAGTYTVDWGDGSSPTTYASGAVAQYNFSFSSISSGTTTSQGFRQAIITVTATTDNLTGINLNTKYVNTPVLSRYNAQWLDVTVGSPNLTSLAVQSITQNVTLYSLKQFTLMSMSSSLTTLEGLFYGCNALESFVLGSTSVTSNVTNFIRMFFGCAQIKNVPYFDTSSANNMNNMFGQCYKLQTVPKFITTNVIYTYNMFINCYQLIEIPQFDTSNVGDASSMFSGCISLETIPYLNLSKNVYMQAMFFNCRSLRSIPLIDTANVQNTVNTFSFCSSLTSIPELDFSSVGRAEYTFNGCSSLTSIPELDLSFIQNSYSMFTGCSSLVTVPALDLGNSRDYTSLFQNCSALEEIGNINIKTNLTVVMTSMFTGCNSLNSVPLFDTSNVTNMFGMFASCSSLNSVPLFNTVNVANMGSMFNSCGLLENVPLFDTSNANNVSGMFSSCLSLETLPAFNLNKAININNFIQNSPSIKNLPAYNFTNATAGASGFATNANSLSKLDIVNNKYTIGLTNCQLDKTNLELFFTNCSNVGAGGQTITITGNPGADTALTGKTSTWTTSSNVVTMANTVGVVVGCQLTQANLTATITATSYANSKISFPTVRADANTMVSFTNAGASGLSANTIYYTSNVSGAGPYYYDISATPGGSPISLSAGTLTGTRISRIVTNVNANSNVTISATPSVAGSGLFVTSRTLITDIATFKGYTITG